MATTEFAAHAELWSDYEFADGAVPIADLGALSDLTIQKQSDGNEGFTLVAPDSIKALLVRRRVVRVEDVFDAVIEGRIATIAHNRDAGTVTVTCQGPRYDLIDAGYVRRIVGDRVLYSIGGDFSDADWIDNDILSFQAEDSLTHFQRGPITGLSGTVAMQLTGRTTRATLLDALVKGRGEWAVVRNAGAGKYDITLATAIGIEAEIVQAAYPDTLTSHDDDVDADPLFTVVVPKGAVPAGDTEPADPGDNVWDVTDRSGAGPYRHTLNDPDTGDPLVIEDGQSSTDTGHALRLASGTIVPILASYASDNAVEVDAVIPIGEQVQLLATEDGLLLSEIGLPSLAAVYGRKVRDIDFSAIRGERNLLRNGNFVAGLTGWRAEGAAELLEYARDEVGNVDGLTDGARAAGGAASVDVDGFPADLTVRRGMAFEIAAAMSVTTTADVLVDDAGVAVLPIGTLPSTVADGARLTCNPSSVPALVPGVVIGHGTSPVGGATLTVRGLRRTVHPKSGYQLILDDTHHNPAGARVTLVLDADASWVRSGGLCTVTVSISGTVGAVYVVAETQVELRTAAGVFLGWCTLEVDTTGADTTVALKVDGFEQLAVWLGAGNTFAMAGEVLQVATTTTLDGSGVGTVPLIAPPQVGFPDNAVLTLRRVPFYPVGDGGSATVARLTTSNSTPLTSDGFSSTDFGASDPMYVVLGGGVTRSIWAHVALTLWNDGLKKPALDTTCRAKLVLWDLDNDVELARAITQPDPIVFTFTAVDGATPLDITLRAQFILPSSRRVEVRVFASYGSVPFTAHMPFSGCAMVRWGMLTASVDGEIPYTSGSPANIMILGSLRALVQDAVPPARHTVAYLLPSSTFSLNAITRGGLCEIEETGELRRIEAFTLTPFKPAASELVLSSLPATFTRERTSGSSGAIVVAGGGVSVGPGAGGGPAATPLLTVVDGFGTSVPGVAVLRLGGQNHQVTPESRGARLATLLETNPLRESRVLAGFDWVERDLDEERFDITIGPGVAELDGHYVTTKTPATVTLPDAFPSIGLIDDFNRADATIDAGDGAPIWQHWGGGTPLDIVSNEATGGGAVQMNMLRRVDGPDFRYEFTVGSVGAAGTCASHFVVSTGPGDYNGFRCVYGIWFGTPTLTLIHNEAIGGGGTPTTIAGPVALSVSPGDAWAWERRGARFRLEQRLGGVWQFVASAINSDFAGPGAMAMSMQAVTTLTVTEVWGGTIGAAIGALVYLGLVGGVPELQTRLLYPHQPLPPLAPGELHCLRALVDIAEEGPRIYEVEDARTFARAFPRGAWDLAVRMPGCVVDAGDWTDAAAIRPDGAIRWREANLGLWAFADDPAYQALIEAHLELQRTGFYEVGGGTADSAPTWAAVHGTAYVAQVNWPYDVDDPTGTPVPVQCASHAETAASWVRLAARYASTSDGLTWWDAHYADLINALTQNCVPTVAVPDSGAPDGHLVRSFQDDTLDNTAKTSTGILVWRTLQDALVILNASSDPTQTGDIATVAGWATDLQDGVRAMRQDGPLNARGDDSWTAVEFDVATETILPNDHAYLDPDLAVYAHAALYGFLWEDAPDDQRAFIRDGFTHLDQYAPNYWRTRNYDAPQPWLVLATAATRVGYRDIGSEALAFVERHHLNNNEDDLVDIHEMGWARVIQRLLAGEVL